MAEDIRKLEDQYDANERDARLLVNDLSEKLGTWHADAGSWSVAECLDHLATTNRIYLETMRVPATQALNSKRRGARRASPGLVGRLICYSLEPPVKSRSKGKAPAIIRPRMAVPLADAFSAFTSSQAELRAFVREYADIDFSGVMFPNPFIKWLRLSLASATSPSAGRM